MISAIFYKNGENFCGFRISGHSGYADSGSDIVCAAVTSSVQLCANLITDFFRLHSEAKASGSTVSVQLKKGSDEADRTNADLLIGGLYTQLGFIAGQFVGTISITTMEV